MKRLLKLYVLLRLDVMSDSKLVFTASSVLDLLLQIDELSDKDISLTESSDNQYTLTIGETTYTIAPDAATEIDVDSNVVDQVDEVDESTYDELEQAGDVSIEDTIEGGLIKSLVKTLLLGGMVKLSSKLLK